MVAVDSDGRVGFYRETGVGHDCLQTHKGAQPKVLCPVKASTPRSVWSDVHAHAGCWTHVAASYDGKQISVRINGTYSEVSKPAGPMMQPPKGSVYSRMPLLIGARSTIGEVDAHFHGTVDDVKVWAGKRTPLDTFRDFNS